MTDEVGKRWLSASTKRILVYCALFGILVAWDSWRRHWSPGLTLETEHYRILSSATEEQTKEIGEATEALFEAYTKFFAGLFTNSTGGARLRMNLYKDREEFRRCHRFIGWAEALYQKPYCEAYFSTSEINPRHWMLHD